MANRHIPDEVKNRLMTRARSRFNDRIFPVRGAFTVEDSFMVYEELGWYCLWFNDDTNSTHIVHELITEEE